MLPAPPHIRGSARKPEKETSFMATKEISMPPKEEILEEAPVRKGQLRPTQERYLLQVDRQTKRSFADVAEAQKAGEAVKKAYPMVMVSIYDSAESVSLPIT